LGHPASVDAQIEHREKTQRGKVEWLQLTGRVAMAEEVLSDASSQTPLPPRSVRLIRVAVLALAGVVIAFSATLHEQLGFDVAVAAVSIAAVGVAHTIEWLSLRSSGGNPISLLLSLVAFAAAGGLVLSSTSIGFAITIAAWALASALLEFIAAATRPGSRQDATLLGAVGVLLALLVLLVREDQVAILGFLGSYAVIAAVFLGISAFDHGQVTTDRFDGSASASQA
jgi:hypothetical protein